ncbi:MAG: ABC transporter ATP-binding protein [Candidatus Poribacteria bacterium]|nr:ABC transporter ATP-binding protein [Candidatus Poribacteria bacterium]
MRSSDRLVVHQVIKHFYRKKPLSADEKPSFMQKVHHLFRRDKEVIKAVDTISFEVGMGQIYGILGPNGSGKSTLIRLISTLLLPDSGHITVCGNDVVQDSFKVRQMINRVSVEASFFKKLSSEENLIYAARLYGVPVRQARRKAGQILRRIGFDTKRIDEQMENLSRGMQQKVAIARALLTSPILLLLDEPTTGLDPKSKRDVQQCVDEIRHEHDAIILLTTHDMEEAEKMCDRIAIIDDGKFIAEGTAKELKSLVTKAGGEATLEDVFIELTGNDLREEG